MNVAHVCPACGRILTRLCIPIIAFVSLVLASGADGQKKSARETAEHWIPAPITVKDIIERTEDGGKAIFSPDRKQLVLVTKKGDLVNNTMVYSLLLFNTKDIFDSPAPRILVSMPSSSSRAGIEDVKWI